MHQMLLLASVCDPSSPARGLIPLWIHLSTALNALSWFWKGLA